MAKRDALQRAGIASCAEWRAWPALDRVEALEIPPDLAAAPAASPATEHAFATLPRSARRVILE